MPPDKPEPTVEQFARALVKMFDAQQRIAESYRESAGSRAMREAAMDIAISKRGAAKTVRDLAAAHGVKIKEEGSRNG